MSLARLVLLAPLLAIRPAVAADECFNVKAEMTPSASLQIVVWLETASGQFVDTLYITAKTGFYGLGNRPGRMDFNSGPVPNDGTGVDDMWPYGRRVSTFPVWAHRHGLSWPEVVFQDGNESGLSHSQGECSIEATPPYCRPVADDNAKGCGVTGGSLATDEEIWDTGTCASKVFTDKGELHPTRLSLYPPRADLTRQPVDSPDVAMFADLNPFDAITRATPTQGDPLVIDYTVPEDADTGGYVLYAEVSKAFDFNGTYNETSYPPPTVAYSQCGLPYRGQPSVVYKVPFTVSPTLDVKSTANYDGYGDVNGDNGTLHPADATITSDTPGSGALRLQLVSDNGELYRMRVTLASKPDLAPPGLPVEVVARDLGATTAVLEFVESGDDGEVGAVSRYEVRVMANGEITEDNFEGAIPVLARVMPVEPGNLARLEITGLLPETEYSIGVRAVDDCFKKSAIVVTHFTTGERAVGSVDACFVATAAYGSMMANDVGVLRTFRDSLLAKSILGELAIEAYYTFGPAMAGVIGESDVLRATARAALAPVVERVRKLEL